MTDFNRAKELAEILGSLSEPHRILIIEILRTGTKNVTEISRILDNEIVNISHHLSVLRGTGIVQDVKEGRFVYYSLHPDKFNISDPSMTVMDLGWCRIEIPHML